MPQQGRSKRPSRKYNAEELDLILGFLAVCLKAAQTALDGVIRMAGSDRKHPLMAGQIAHYSSVISALKWGAHLAKTGHKELDPSDDFFRKAVESWK